MHHQTHPLCRWTSLCHLGLTLLRRRLAHCSGKHCETGLLIHFFVLMPVGTPLAWHKGGGSLGVDWIGYNLEVGRFEVGINEKRAR